MSADLLPSWRPGGPRDALVDFLDHVRETPVEDRVALFDNDGTLWCERPRYVQLDFFVNALRQRAAADPSLRKRPEFAAVLEVDADAMGRIGVEKIALALAGLFDGYTPGEFATAVDEFVSGYRHRTLDVPLEQLVYQPMLELIAALRTHDFTIGIVTGGGTEFVRRVSQRLYGVAPELVVGTLIGYRFQRDGSGLPQLVRTVSLTGDPNEGVAKVGHIQSQLGRAPILAAGNSAGDREMLEWAGAHPDGGLAVLIDHDDADREFAYVSTAATFTEDESITDVADRLGWVTVSIRDDWETVFPLSDDARH